MVWRAHSQRKETYRAKGLVNLSTKKQTPKPFSLLSQRMQLTSPAFCVYQQFCLVRKKRHRGTQADLPQSPKTIRQ